MSSYSASTAGSIATLFSNLNLNTSISISKLLPSSACVYCPRGTGTRLRTLSFSVRARVRGAKFKRTQMRETKQTEIIESKAIDATEMCAGSGDGKTSMEEVNQAKAQLGVKLEKEENPIRSFCSENPETDECVISYD